ncbi:MAG: hydroxymethylbilane synthase, partial [Phycisphaerae bacterium]
RLRKLEAGACDAAVLAQAGVGRLGILDGRMVALEPSVMLPAAGQGALGLEFRSEAETVRRWIGPLDDPPSRLAVACERALVRRLGAGCRTALGVLATVNNSGNLMLDVWLLSPTGQEALRRRAEGPAEGPESIGSHLAEQLLEAGAARLMATESGEADA